MGKHADKFREAVGWKQNYEGSSRLQALEAVADEAGWTLVLPKANELFIDIDEPRIPVEIEEKLRLVDELVGIDLVDYTESPGGNRHLYVTLERDVFNVWERLALQAVLGSDWKRECLSINDAHNEEEVSTCFFENQGIHRQPYHWTREDV